MRSMSPSSATRARAGRSPSPADRSRNTRRRPAPRRACRPSVRRSAAFRRRQCAMRIARSRVMTAASSWSCSTRTSETISAPGQRVGAGNRRRCLRARRQPAARSASRARVGDRRQVEQHQRNCGRLRRAAATEAPSPPPTSSRQRWRRERIGIEHLVARSTAARPPSARCRRRPASRVSAAGWRAPA